MTTWIEDELARTRAAKLEALEVATQKGVTFTPGAADRLTSSLWWSDPEMIAALRDADPMAIDVLNDPAMRRTKGAQS